MKPILLAALSAALSLAQAPSELKFEVASVRPSQPAGQDRVDVGLHTDGAQVRINSFPIRDYIARAFRLKVYQITGPDWLSSERFDLSAKLPDGATPDQIPEMLQSLLTDRFQMKFHRERKDLPVYALILGKPPLKIQPSAPEAPGTEGKSGVNVAGTGSAAGVSVDLGNGSYYSFLPPGKFEAKKMSMDMLARQIERYADRPIVDMTNLKGAYDINFTVTQEDYQVMLIRAALNGGMILPPQALQVMENGSIASLLDALQQLGLKMDARKAPLDVVAIDSISKTPTEN
jgi:uncharacterized protein (TIGR03435 family)